MRCVSRASVTARRAALLLLLSGRGPSLSRTELGVYSFAESIRLVGYTRTEFSRCRFVVVAAVLSLLPPDGCLHSLVWKFDQILLLGCRSLLSFRRFYRFLWLAVTEQVRFGRFVFLLGLHEAHMCDMQSLIVSHKWTVIYYRFLMLVYMNIYYVSNGLRQKHSA